MRRRKWIKEKKQRQIQPENSSKARKGGGLRGGRGQRAEVPGMREREREREALDMCLVVC